MGLSIIYSLGSHVGISKLYCVSEHLFYLYKHKKLATRACFTYISKLKHDFTVSHRFYFHETLHVRSFMKKNMKISNFTVLIFTV